MWFYNNTDYYAFGAPLNGRNFNSTASRNGFNGQMKDDEVYGAGNLNTAEYWEYDTRLGRRWNIDPIEKEYESSYACFSDNPIMYADPNGADKVLTDTKTGEVTNKPDANGSVMIEHSKGTWNEDHTAFKATETVYEHITYESSAMQNVDDIDLGEAEKNRKLWKQTGENFKDLADFSEKAVLTTFAGAGAAMAVGVVAITYGGYATITTAIGGSPRFAGYALTLHTSSALFAKLRQ